ncbi:MAG: hypothetical protein WCK02_08830 [Bacteroidota bacterium]
MFDYYYIKESCSESSSSDLMAIASFAVSAFAVFITYYAVYEAKKTEIKYEKFKKLCLELIVENLEYIKSLLNENINSEGKMKISNSFSDLTLLFIEIKNIYPNMDIDELQNIIFTYTDSLYSSETNFIYEFNKLRINLISKIYDFALYYELNFFQRKIFQKRK